MRRKKREEGEMGKGGRRYRKEGGREGRAEVKSHTVLFHHRAC